MSACTIEVERVKFWSRYAIKRHETPKPRCPLGNGRSPLDLPLVFNPTSKIEPNSHISDAKQHSSPEQYMPFMPSYAFRILRVINTLSGQTTNALLSSLFAYMLHYVTSRHWTDYIQEVKHLRLALAVKKLRHWIGLAVKKFSDGVMWLAWSIRGLANQTVKWGCQVYFENKVTNPSTG